MKKRVFLIILDSFGIGELPDAYKFGDRGANTLKSVSNSEKLSIPNLIKCGLGNIDGVDCIEKTNTPLGVFAKCAEKSMGKDTTVGHWEIAGLISNKPLPTYPNGFPKEIINRLEAKTGREIICNRPYSGTRVLEDYGAEHEKTGKLIVYTSADSVLQIAANEAVVPLEELYRYCQMAREIMVDSHGVGRIIARPFVYKNGKYIRTEGRRDFSLEPNGKTLLDSLKEGCRDVIAVGKIRDIFAGRGITEHIPTHSNKEGLDATLDLMEKDFNGLAFVNLVDFDMVYGHRNDTDGYARALSEFDTYLGKILPKLKVDDTLIITADHGCDPGDTSTDHTREYVPLLIIGNGITPKNLGVFSSYAVIGDYVASVLEVDFKTQSENIEKRINDKGIDK